MSNELFAISLKNAGRRFNREWIFRKIEYTFLSGYSYAILGSNGAGKSTLLQVLIGSLAPSEGNVSYLNGDAEIPYADVFKHISIAAPYIELIEEFTLSEMIDFHFKFKSYYHSICKADIIALLGFAKAENKQVKYFSSGMKQRLKLALAFCSDTAALMLDEPTSNLDTQGIDWYRSLVNRFAKGRLTIVCSNQAAEYDFCDYVLNISDYKS